MEDFLEGIAGIVAIILTLGIPIFALYLALNSSRARHKENMELIRQGILPPTSATKPTPNKYRSLRNGFLCIGIALGIIIDIIIKLQCDLSVTDNLLILSGLVLLFLGIAYVAFYLIIRDKNELNSESGNE